MENCENTLSTTNKVPFDPGWNDPPTFTYNAQQTTPSRPRNFLNKRVAFPVSNNAGVPSGVPVTIPSIPAAMPISPMVPPPVSNIATIIEPQEKVQIDCGKILEEVKDALLEILGDSSELGSKAESIRKKISLMEDMWTSGKLNTQVQIRMQELTRALKEDKPDKADEIHKGLMVDHVSLVGIWMPGVKQIIYNCIARTELLAIDKE
ncbi:steroid receptor RNA activator 1-like [Zerene cesonia]|uniref:steroid receptor RNA activator 1-like n=1 Tax=Zerene cesonia TaxID=33412 RepID=UPI0018E53F0D|nr:steroid receptor RNA activator 1-like [Zerene cesonia]